MRDRTFLRFAREIDRFSSIFYAIILSIYRICVIMHELLIELVKQHEVLYNSKVFNYRDPIARIQAWKKIAKDLEIKPVEARNRWDKLRRCYLNALNRRREKVYKSGPPMLPWKYENKMAFLLPFVDRRRSQCVFEISSPRDPNDLIMCDEDQSVDSMQQNFESHTSNDLDAQLHIVEYKTEISDKSNDSIDGIEFKARTQSIEDNSPSTSHHKEHSISKKIKSNKDKITDIPSINKMDDTDLFFLTMSRMTKKLTKIEQSNIKLILSNAVFQAEIRNHEKYLVNNNCQQQINSTDSIEAFSSSSENDDEPSSHKIID